MVRFPRQYWYSSTSSLGGWAGSCSYSPSTPSSFLMVWIGWMDKPDFHSTSYFNELNRYMNSRRGILPPALGPRKGNFLLSAALPIRRTLSRPYKRNSPPLPSSLFTPAIPSPGSDKRKLLPPNFVFPSNKLKFFRHKGNPPRRLCARWSCTK